MEVRVDALGAPLAPPDTFVSVRIGDVQKQSRFSDSRTYRFPDPGQGRDSYGRIEVFKRIGHLTVKFDDLDGRVQDVDVPCDFPGLKKLSMRLAVQGAGPPEGLLPQVKARVPVKVKSKKEAAQKYLEEHKLEDLLAEAMRELIHNKPRDPHGFLSTHIMKRQRTVTVNLPPIAQGSAPGSPSAQGFAKSRSRPGTREKLPVLFKELPPPLPLDAVAPTEDLPPPLPLDSMEPPEELFKELPPPLPLDAVAPTEAPPRMAKAPLTDFASYYRENFSGVQLPGLYAKFPGPRRVVAAARPPPAKPAGFGVYYKEHFRGLPAPPLAGLYAKFKPAKRVQFKTATAAAPPTLQGPGFKSLPSVGTWLRKPKTTPPAPAVPAAPPPVPGPRQFAQMPSVGTWLQGPRLPMAGSRAGASSSAAGEKPARAVPFKLKPSVGTWLAYKPFAEAPPPAAAAAAPAVWTQRPSVGTWLSPPRRARAAATGPPVRHILELAPARLQAMSKEELVTVVRDELAQKDREIESLKSQVDRLLRAVAK